MGSSFRDKPLGSMRSERADRAKRQESGSTTGSESTRTSMSATRPENAELGKPRISRSDSMSTIRGGFEKLKDKRPYLGSATDLVNHYGKKLGRGIESIAKSPVESASPHEDGPADPLFGLRDRNDHADSESSIGRASPNRRASLSSSLMSHSSVAFSDTPPSSFGAESPRVRFLDEEPDATRKPEVTRPSSYTQPSVPRAEENGAIRRERSGSTVSSAPSEKAGPLSMRDSNRPLITVPQAEFRKPKVSTTFDEINAKLKWDDTPKPKGGIQRFADRFKDAAKATLSRGRGADRLAAAMAAVPVGIGLPNAPEATAGMLRKSTRAPRSMHSEVMGFTMLKRLDGSGIEDQRPARLDVKLQAEHVNQFFWASQPAERTFPIFLQYCQQHKLPVSNTFSTGQGDSLDEPGFGANQVRQPNLDGVNLKNFDFSARSAAFDTMIRFAAKTKEPEERRFPLRDESDPYRAEE